MIPVECVIRNYAAGSLCRRLGVEEGKELHRRLLNYSSKMMLGYRMVNESQAIALGWATAEAT